MSETALRWPDADLRDHPPRNAREQLAGLVFLPRTIDKIRAKLQGTLGFYKVTPGISAYLLEWIGIGEDALTEVVASGASDEQIGAWVRAHSDPAAYPDVNARLAARGIRDDAHLAEVLPRYPVLRDHPHLRNWFEIFDVDDRWSFDPANAAKV